MSMRSTARHGTQPQARVSLIRHRPVVILGVVGWLGIAGCGGLEPVASYQLETDPAQLYLALTLEPRAITLDTATGYNTVQLTATPRDGRGEAMVGLPAPTFQLATPGDSTSLRVTSAGLLTGLNAGSNIEVIAELTVPGPSGYPVRHEERARVSIKTTTPPQVSASLSIDPPDSAARAMISRKGLMTYLGLLEQTPLRPVVLDVAGQPISGVVTEYSSLDPAIVTVEQWSGVITARLPGQARVVARATVSNVTLVDTTVLTITWPANQLIDINAGPGGVVLEPSDDIRIVPYGVVEWSNNTGDATAITFDDPTNVIDPANGSPAASIFCSILEGAFSDAEICANGDMVVPGFDPEVNPGALSLRVRQFPVLGVYRFHVTRTGATGRVVVTNEAP